MNKYLVAFIIGSLLVLPFIMAATPSLTDRVNNLEQRISILESKSTQPIVPAQAPASSFMFSGHGNSSTTTTFVNSMATINCTTSNTSGGIQVLQVVLCNPAKYDVNNPRAVEASFVIWNVKGGSDTNISTLYQPAGYYYLKVHTPAEVSWGINIR